MGRTPAPLAVLDAPCVTDVIDRFGFHAHGWVWLGKEHPRIQAVQLWSSGVLVGVTDALYHRPDVCSALGIDPSMRTGFRAYATVPTAARGASVDLSVRVLFVDGRLSEALCSGSARSLGFDDVPNTDSGPADHEIRGRASKTESWPLPPTHLQTRQVGSDWGRNFYVEGRVIFEQLRRAFNLAGADLGKTGPILDFGCGCGRVISAFADLADVQDLWGCDIDAEAVAWNHANLGHQARFCVNPALPPTAFADGQFDAIYSVSVFTHLPEDLQFVWLNELRRILRPGGVLVASVHGGHVYSQVPDGSTRVEVATRGFAYRTGPPTTGLPDFYMLALHSEAYIRTAWTRYFEFVGLKERGIHGVQDAVVLRRRAG